MDEDTSSLAKHFIRKPELKLEKEDTLTALLLSCVNKEKEEKEDNSEIVEETKLLCKSSSTDKYE